MIKKTGKFIAVLTVSVMSVCFIHAPAVVAANVMDNGDFRYKLSDEDKTAEIISYEGKSLFVSVPDSVEGYTVVSIGTAAFRENETIKELEIPETIREIEDGAFQDCVTLKKVQIPGSVIRIGNFAFSGCEKLTDINIADGLTDLGNYAFSECTSLEKINLPNSLDSIGDYAFLNCTSLSSPGVPKALRSFGKYALENTKWMKAQKSDFVTIGDGILIKYTGDSEVKSVSDNVKVIGSYAFAGNSKIKQVMLPSSVNSIDTSAFEDCTALSNIYIPSSVAQIGERAFCGCTALKTVKFPNGINTIESSVFMDSGLESFETPPNVSSINESAFEGCAGLKNIKIGDGVKKICKNSFRNCGLSRVVFPTTLKEIDENAFDGCGRLLRAEFNGETTLKAGAFNECSNLSAVVFYKNPPELEDSVFSLTPKAVIYSDNNVYLQEYASRNGKQIDSIRNLPPYDENAGLTTESEGSVEFSTGYTLIGFLIIVVDLALVILTSVYILFIEPKQKQKRRAKLAAKRAAVSKDDKEPVTYVKAPKRTKERPDSVKRQGGSTKQQPNRNPQQKRPAHSPTMPKIQNNNPHDNNIRGGNTKTFERPGKH